MSKHKGFILDGITLGKTKFIDSYNALLDENLVGYFNKGRRQYLKKNGLLTKDGILISNKMIS
jgi:hypothetical protein